MIVMDKIRTTNLLRPMDLTLLCVPVQFETTMLCTWQSNYCEAQGHGAMPGTKKMPDLELILKVVMPSDPTFHFRN